MGIQIRAGLQKDGGYLYGYDLEGPSHGPTFDADREWEALEICTRPIAHPRSEWKSLCDLYCIGVVIDPVRLRKNFACHLQSGVLNRHALW
jgi:hypothetical protein